MNNEIYTVDEVAQILNMHPKTIRRYIRERKFKAVKVGGQWRVLAEDLKIFMNTDAYIEKATDENINDLISFITGTSVKAQDKIQACTIIDIYVNSPDEINQTVQGVIDIINNNPNPQGNIRFQYMYYREEKKARFTLWGSPKLIARILDSINI